MMSKMSPDERRKRRNAVAAEALESVAKTEQFNFRVDAETIKRLYEIAGEQRKSVGALVREWVQDRLTEQQSAPSSAELLKEMRAFRRETALSLHDLHQQVAVNQEFGALRKPGKDSAASSQSETPQSYSEDSAGDMHLAESSASNSYLPVTGKMSRPELLAELENLTLKNAAYYEVPKGIIDYLKKELKG